MSDWLTNWIFEFLTACLTVCLSVSLSVCLTLHQLPWRHLPTTLPCNCMPLFEFRLWGWLGCKPQFLLAVCVLSGHVWIFVAGNSYEFSGTFIYTRMYKARTRATHRNRTQGRFHSLNVPLLWQFYHMMMRSVIWLFGYLGKSSNLFAIVVDTAIRCNCVEIDMRCYFNRSFPSLPLYTHTYTRQHNAQCITKVGLPLPSHGQIWFMHISIWFISLASLRNVSSIRHQLQIPNSIPHPMATTVARPFTFYVAKLLF